MRTRTHLLTNPRMPPSRAPAGTRSACPYSCCTASARRCSPGAASCGRSPASPAPIFSPSTGLRLA
uniref:Uncharacterized protein n=1 Tax=Arundo donax TaxID=35708 RepID=A0A0A9E156_ARUDO